MKVDGIAKPPANCTAPVDYEHEHEHEHEHRFAEHEFEDREQPITPCLGSVNGTR